MGRPKSDVNREPRIEGDNVIIDSTVHEEMDKETFMEMFNERSNKINQLRDQRSNLMSQLNVIKKKVPDDMSDEEKQRLDKLKEDMDKVEAMKEQEKKRETLQNIDVELENQVKDYEEFKKIRDKLQED